MFEAGLSDEASRRGWSPKGRITLRSHTAAAAA